MENILNNQKGATALFITLLVLTAVTTITFAGSQIILTNMRLSRERYDSTRAYYAAESGAEKILWEMRKAPDPFNLDLLCPNVFKVCFEPDGSLPTTNPSCVARSDSCAPNFEDFALVYPNEGKASTTIHFGFLDYTGSTTIEGTFRSTGRRILLRY